MSAKVIQLAENSNQNIIGEVQKCIGKLYFVQVQKSFTAYNC